MVNGSIQKSEPVIVWCASYVATSDLNEIYRKVCFQEHSESCIWSNKQKGLMEEWKINNINSRGALGTISKMPRIKYY